MSERFAPITGLPEEESSTPPPPLEAEGLRKTFIGGDGSTLEILDGVDMRVTAGEAVAITGASGAGKSTLLHILGALDRPTAGRVKLGGRDVSELGDEALAEVRNRHVGFVFQFHHLLREFTALENVMMPALVGSSDQASAKARAKELLAEVGLEHREQHQPRQLSGGEQQRVAVARALVNRPLVLLADEPSGNLDMRTSDRLHGLLFELRERRNLSLVVVTHNGDLAGMADRILDLEGGRLHPTTSV
ncbi:MAG: ABC transporter ATP-binding protein [Gemmatimonadota bacterium]|nr:ABC transporter ATP-binding protein [Gemmatimonadota bacterium]